MSSVLSCSYYIGREAELQAEDVRRLKDLLFRLLKFCWTFGKTGDIIKTNGNGTPKRSEIKQKGDPVMIVSSTHECAYCGEVHDDKTTEGLLIGFFHIVLYVFEQFKSIFESIKK